MFVEHFGCVGSRARGFATRMVNGTALEGRYHCYFLSSIMGIGAQQPPDLSQVIYLPRRGASFQIQTAESTVIGC